MCAIMSPACLLLLVATAVAHYTLPANNANSLGPDANGKYEISAKGIRGLFIPYGASISNLFVAGKDGKEHDVVLGFDNATAYEAKLHPHLGGVPGRYANRIRNSSFFIDGSEYHVLPNENNNNNTLHGGPDGWDYRNFTVVAHTEDSITFSLVDPDGKEGFPGEVVSYISYTMTENTWTIKMVALATTRKTPIMLTSHVSIPDVVERCFYHTDWTGILESRWVCQSGRRHSSQSHAPPALLWPACQRRWHSHTGWHHFAQYAVFCQRLLVRTQKDRR